VCHCRLAQQWEARFKTALLASKQWQPSDRPTIPPKKRNAADISYDYDSTHSQIARR
jgi:hypothetical protein